MAASSMNQIERAHGEANASRNNGIIDKFQFQRLFEENSMKIKDTNEILFNDNALIGSIIKIMEDSDPKDWYVLRRDFLEAVDRYCDYYGFNHAELFDALPFYIGLKIGITGRDLDVYYNREKHDIEIEALEMEDYLDSNYVGMH